MVMEMNKENPREVYQKVYLQKKCNWCGANLVLKKRYHCELGEVCIYQCENEECGHTISIIDVTKKNLSAG